MLPFVEIFCSAVFQAHESLTDSQPNILISLQQYKYFFNLSLISTVLQVFGTILGNVKDVRIVLRY